MSHLDQTRFITVATADELIRQYYLKDELQAIEGTTFELKLKLDDSSSDKITGGSMTLIADRRNTTHPAFTHANQDDVLQTFARVETGGEPFQIDLTLPYGTSSNEGAQVTVSPEMDRIIFEYIARQDAAWCDGVQTLSTSTPAPQGFSQLSASRTRQEKHWGAFHIPTPLITVAGDWHFISFMLK